jgi:general secretion pathway protein D
VPVATGSFQPGIGGVGINPLVNTQFQYLDVGVNIDITPRVHAGREISMKLSMDVSAVDSYVSIGGISQPVIGQRKIEHEIRLRDGEVSLLGGMMEDSRTKSIAGIPGLASIPLLKYLFSQDTSDHSTNEIVFVLIPHILRGPDTSHGAGDMIDVGTANAISLRLNNTKNVTPVAPVTPVPAPVNPGVTPPGAAVLGNPGNPQGSVPPRPVSATPGGAAAMFMFDPPTLTQAKGSTFTVNVMVSGGQNVYSVPVQLNYDPDQLQVVNVSNGGFLSQDGQIVTVAHREDPTTGTMQITASRPPGAGGVSGQGAVVTLTFMAKTPGQSALTITRGGARDPAMQPIAMSGAQAAITIQ